MKSFRIQVNAALSVMFLFQRRIVQMKKIQPHMKAALTTGLLFPALALVLSATASTVQTDLQARSSKTKHVGTLPLSFEQNKGQTDSQVKFLTRMAKFNLFLTKTGASLVPRTQSSESSTVNLEWIGAQASIPVGQEHLAYKSNYFIGRDPKRWQQNVPHYSRVVYSSLYPGVDLVWYGNQKQLEYDLQLSPGANLHQIRLQITGIQRLSVDKNGDLLLSIKTGTVHQSKPLMYQWRNGQRQTIGGRYIQRGPHQIGFSADNYDSTKPLVIDPVLSYFTYLGGSGNEDAQGIAVDRKGMSYVTGHTTSINFPVTSPAARSENAGLTDIYVTKFNENGSQAIYSTYLGGSSNDFGVAIALDNNGNAYVRGSSGSQDYPVTQGVLQSTYNGGGSDAVVTKLSSTGDNLLYSTYLGGSGDEAFSFAKRSIAVDQANNAYISGDTSSTDFPITLGAFRKDYGGGATDGFVTKLNPTATDLVYSTYLPGNGNDGANSIALDYHGNAYVAGFTSSTNFPVTSDSFQTTSGGAIDAFAVKLNPTGSNAIYSTYLGGSGSDGAGGIALDRTGNAYLIGATGPGETNFPISPGALQPVYAGGTQDMFVAKLNRFGNALVYSTYLGGNGRDFGADISVDRYGRAYAVGATASTNYPVSSDATQLLFGGGSQDASLSILDVAGKRLLYSTYMGGAGADNADGVAVDPWCSTYLTWTTESAGLPTTVDAFQPTFGGNRDAAVSKWLPLAKPTYER
jgi:Beta-propeller repeat